MIVCHFQPTTRICQLGRVPVSMKARVYELHRVHTRDVTIIDFDGTI